MTSLRRTIIAVSAILFFSIVGLTTYSGQLEKFANYAQKTVVEPSSRQPNNWKHLCSQMDCNQFPEGYITVKWKGPTFYLPLKTALKGSVFGVVGPYEKKYLQWSSAGTLRRVVYLYSDARNVTLFPCCTNYMTDLGLMTKWPAFVSKVTHVAVKEMTEAEMRQRVTMMQAWVKPIYWHDELSLEQLIDKSPPSIGQHFWLLWEQVASKSSSSERKRLIRQIRFVSKKPLLFGRHVVGICGANCTYFLYTFPTTKTSLKKGGDLFNGVNLSFKIDGLRILSHEAQYCKQDNSILTCDDGIDDFNVLPSAFKLIELFFRKISRYPEA